MKNLKFNYLGVISIVAFLFLSCNDDDDNNITIAPIKIGSSVTVTNTFQSTAFTNDVETDIETLFQQPAGSLAASATVSNNVEFSGYLLNLYDIDIAEKKIKFTVVAQANDPVYGNLFRVLETNTYDRYYLTFDKNQNVQSATSSNSSVRLRIDAPNILVVEIGEGYDFKPDQNFTITLN